MTVILYDACFFYCSPLPSFPRKTSEKHAYTVLDVFSDSSIRVADIIYSRLLSINTRITGSQGRSRKKGHGSEWEKKGVSAYKRARDTLF